MAQTDVLKLYQSIILDVISNVREAFIDEGFDEQTLTELKQLWEKKLAETKAGEPERVLTKTQPLRVPQVQQHSAGVVSTIRPQSMAIGAGDARRSATSRNVTPRFSFTVPASLAQAGLQTLLTTTPGGTTVQVPPQLAQLIQSNMFQTATQSNPNQQMQYRVLTSEQLQSSPQFAVAIPVTTPQRQPPNMLQLDGANDNDTSDDEEYLSFSDEDDEEADHQSDVEETDPLNSDDDESDEDNAGDFDIDNVVVCQFEKIARSKNRWKFHLKDGIMNLRGKDFIFHKALGDSEW